MRRYESNVAIVVVVSMIAITLAGGAALALSASDFSLSTIGFVSKTSLKQVAYSCEEEALRKISRQHSYTGSLALSQTNGSCSAEISNDVNPNYKNVTIDAIYNDFNYSKSFTIDISTSPISYK